ncbi:hypothetical protein CEXT_1271 [Caerostris extrusa]|uniref:Vitellogenin n=1 Tax=Caerostris extrusa TaxID=172846 RepID=A0AAV4UT32_CAEEX|nr:hypothetical protein CEXT_1271 [Caerostris extrusa]
MRMNLRAKIQNSFSPAHTSSRDGSSDYTFDVQISLTPTSFASSVWCTPIIPENSPDDWVSDDELLEEECESDKPYDGRYISSSMKVQYQPSIESFKDRKIVLNKESYEKSLCRSCKLEDSIDSKPKTKINALSRNQKN